MDIVNGKARLDTVAEMTMTEAEAKAIVEGGMEQLAECIGPVHARAFVLNEAYDMWGLPQTWTATEAPGRALGAFMRYRRDNLGLSLHWVSHLTGIGLALLKRMEQGRDISPEDTDLLFIWGRALGIDDTWMEGLIRTGFYLPEPTTSEK